MKPKIDRIRVMGEPALSVEYSGYRRTILIADTQFRMTGDIQRDTFVNICYHVCKMLRTSYKFVYVSVSNSPKSTITKMCRKLGAQAVVFVDETLTQSFASMTTKSFGCLRKHESGIKYISTIPFRYWTDETYKKSAVGPNTLGFTLRHLIIAAQGKMLFTKLDYSNHKFVEVKTMKQFKSMMDVLDSHRTIAIDTEGSSLGRVTSKLFSMQFGVKKEDGQYLCYFLPWEHRQTPWSSADLRYITKRLVKHFKTTKATHVYHSSSFDIGQFMTHLGLRFYMPKVYDIAQGEFLLDENGKFIRNIYGQKAWALEYMEMRYMIDRPKQTVEKEDRKDMAKFTIEEMFEYAVWDVLTPLVIREYQLETCTHPVIGYKSKKQYLAVLYHQLGMMNKVFSIMQNNGMAIDVGHVVGLARQDGIFGKTIDEVYDKLMKTEAGQKANAIILKKRGVGGNDLWGNKNSKRVLSLTKPEDREILFFDVMKLEPLKTGTTGVRSTDKNFQKKYAGRYPEVALYTDFNKNNKLKSAFADSIASRISTDPDFLFDGRLRPSFNALGVLTGRLAAYDPNSTQIPSRGPLAKPIKKMFIAGKNPLNGMQRVMIATDFSAHEIRLSGALSRDKVIIDTFKMAAEHIIKYRIGPVPNDPAAAIAELDKKIDVHIENVFRFYGLRVDKSNPLRETIKSVVFSAIYGATEMKIARETQATEIQKSIDNKYRAEKALETARKDNKLTDGELAALKKVVDDAKIGIKVDDIKTQRDAFLALKKVISEADRIINLDEEYYLNQATEAFTRLRKTWHELFDWMETTQKNAAKTFQVHYPNYRIRHLYGYLSSDIWVHRAMDRRATNSPVQGVASDIGIVSVHEATKWAYENCWEKGIPFDYAPINVVHDANYNDVQFEHMPLGVYLIEHAMSTLPANYYKRHFDWDMGVPLGYDIDIGLNWADLEEWRKRPEQLAAIIDNIGQKLDKKTAKVQRDAAAIMKVRMQELEKGVNSPMILRGETFEKFASKLNMFQ